MWKLVGKLNKRTDFARNPVESLHRTLRRLVPHAAGISDIGVTEATNAYFREKIEKYVRKGWPGISKRKQEMEIGMAMLQYSPCDVKDGKDFHVYVRIE